MSRLTILGGLSHPSFVNAVCDYLSTKPGKLKAAYLHNGESCVELHESVRGNDVYVIQSGCDDINTSLMELLLIVNACKNASAGQITAVIPCFPYAHQDINTRSRSPITAKLVANMLSSAGCDHVITMDLHASQIQGFFDIPVDNLFVEPGFASWIIENIPNYKSAVIVSPDAGGAKRVASIADRLGVEFALIHPGPKRRTELRSACCSPPSEMDAISDDDNSRMQRRAGQGRRDGPSESTVERDQDSSFPNQDDTDADQEASSRERLILVGSVSGRDAIILDDVCDTGVTVLLAAQKLHEEGACKVYCMVTHGILSSNGVENVRRAKLSKFVCTNTVPQNKHELECPNFVIFDVAAMFGEAIRRTHNGESVSHLFKAMSK